MGSADPSFIAATAQMLQGTNTKANCDCHKKHEQTVRDLERELARAKQGKQDEESRRRELQDQTMQLRKTIENERNEIKYLEFKTELLRRELLARNRSRSRHRESSKHQKRLQADLENFVFRFELDRDHVDDDPKLSRSKAKTSNSQRKPTTTPTPKIVVNPKTDTNTTSDQGKSLEARIGRSPDKGTLADRIGPPTGPRADRRKEDRNAPPPAPTGVNNDVDVDAATVLHNLVPLFDSHGQRIIISRANPMTGYRMERGVVVDVSRPLPMEAPSTDKVNPLTGELWTEDEVDQYPEGIPGWSDNWNGDGKRAVTQVNHQRLRDMDRSRSMVGLPTITNRTDGPPWRFPATREEADHLREVVCTPGNLLALEFWGQFLNHCTSTHKAKRTAVQSYITARKWPRPSWAPFKRSVTNAERKGRKAGKLGDQTEEDASATTAMDLDTGVLTTANHPVDTPTASTSASTNAKTIGNMRLLADVEHLDDWADFLQANPSVTLPGVPRNSDGTVASRSALAGMLRVASLGYSDDTGNRRPCRNF